MKRLAATTVLLLALAAANAEATTTAPPWVDAIRLMLVPDCGKQRAHVLSQLQWDIAIHQDWEKTIVADPTLIPTVGDRPWHEHWIGVYRLTMRLISRDCPGHPAVSIP